MYMYPYIYTHIHTHTHTHTRMHTRTHTHTHTHTHTYIYICINVYIIGGYYYNCSSSTVDKSVWPRVLCMLAAATEQNKEFGVVANPASYALAADICLASGELVCVAVCCNVLQCVTVCCSVL